MIVPKFNIGDTVYVPDLEYTEHRETCPDCMGSGLWPITTPAGETMNLACPTCNPYEWGQASGTVAVREWRVVVRELTVGSVRTNTEARNGETVEYMMNETGVGSGRVYYESRVHSTREEAVPCGERLLTENRESEARREAENRERKKKDARRQYKSFRLDDLREACLKHHANEVYRELTGYDLGERMRPPRKRTV